MAHLANTRRRLRMAWTYVASRPAQLSAKGFGLPHLSWRMLLFVVTAFALFTLTFTAATTSAWADGSSSQSSSAEGSLVDSPENTINARQIADNSFLYDTNVYELMQADPSYQGATVQIVGEVVGDNIRAEEDPGKIWITLEAIEEEYENSISVLVNEDVAKLIDTHGGYNRKGTTLQVRGTYYLACPSHEGIMDIHADAVTLMARGSTTSDEFVLKDFIPGIVLVVVGLLLTLIYYFLRERER